MEQLSLFADLMKQRPVEKSPLVAEIAKLDPNAMTPIDALTTLNELVRKARGDRQGQA